MPYNVSMQSVDRVRKLLDEMIEASADLTWVTNEPIKLSYQLREGMRAALVLGAIDKTLHKYSILRTKYLIRVRGSNLVVAELRYGNIISAASTLPTVMTLNTVTSITEAVGAALEFKHETMLFPSLVPNDSELIQLYNWCQTSGYHIINHEENGLTLTKKESELAWTPSS